MDIKNAENNQQSINNQQSTKDQAMQNALKIIDRYVTAKNKYIPTAFGLHNERNYCWANSLIQFLLSCSQINQLMIENGDDMIKNAKNDSQRLMCLSYQKTVQNALKDRKKLESMSIELVHDLLISLDRAKKRTTIDDVKQQCPDEAIHMIFDMMDSVDLQTICSIRNTSITRCSACNCKSYENMNEPAGLIMDIDYDTNSAINTPDGFVKLILVKSKILDDYKCDKCNDSKNIKINYEFTRRLREVIIMRIRNVMDKKDINSVYYPEYFKVKTEANNILTYRLTSEIIHSGFQIPHSSFNEKGIRTVNYSSGGHYTAICLRSTPNGLKYFHINDETVTEIGDFVCNKNAYLLAYTLQSQ